MKLKLLSTLFVFCFVFLGSAQQTDNNEKPLIAMLGMFHFGETSDLASVKIPDLHSERRQSEIRDLIDMLKTYQPTKILVEHPFNRKDTLQKRYELFLQGDYILGDSETYQLGFRLAKSLGHAKIYAIDHKMDLPFDEIVEHLTKVNQMEKLETMIGMVNGMMQGETTALESMPLSRYLLRLNSEKFDAMANSLYLNEVLNMGSPDNEAGARISATWYHRNMLILKNIASCIASPNERILVIIGSAHRAVIKDYIEDRTDLQYVEIANYMK